MSTPATGPTFAVIGVVGYVARRHLEAIRDAGGTLIACHDISDSVGILDSFFPYARFFGDAARFEEFLREPGHMPDYFVVCTPNDLHLAHTGLGLRLGADVIVEKPPALNTRDLGTMITMEAESGHSVYPVLQLRYHEGLRRFRKLMEWRDPARPVTIT